MTTALRRTRARRTALPSNPRISVVVISRNEGQRLRDTVENFVGTLPDNSGVVVVDDGSTDDSTRFLAKHSRVRLIRGKGLGVARARNLGARQTTGDVIVFADAHIGLNAGWWQPLLELIDDPRVGAAAPAICDMRDKDCFGYGLTLPQPDLHAKWLGEIERPAAVPVLPGCSMAMRRDTFENSGGHDEALLASGGVDNEICVRLWLLGYELWLTPATVVRHFFRSRIPYPLPWRNVVYNRLRLAMVHLSSERLGKVVMALGEYPEFSEAMTMAIESDVTSRRQHLFTSRTRRDEWFFERFNIRW
jgi:GT2 family glycosyltransferase